MAMRINFPTGHESQWDDDLLCRSPCKSEVAMDGQVRGEIINNLVKLKIYCWMISRCLLLEWVFNFEIPERMKMLPGLSGKNGCPWRGERLLGWVAHPLLSIFRHSFVGNVIILSRRMWFTAGNQRGSSKSSVVNYGCAQSKRLFVVTSSNDNSSRRTIYKTVIYWNTSHKSIKFLPICTFKDA